MPLDPDALAARLDEHDVDAIAVDADGDDPTQFYLSAFDAPDPFVTLFDGAVTLVFDRGLELGRARRESGAAAVHTVDSIAGEDADRGTALATLCDQREIQSVGVGSRFPIATADALRSAEIDLAVGVDPIAGQRAIKGPDERDAIARAQRATERAIAAGVAAIHEAAIDASGRLALDGDPLTSERVRAAIHVELVRAGCTPTDTIVAGGPQAGDPHERGSGPLRAGDPIVIDVFPRDDASHYHADTTRTVVRGEPSDRIQEWHALVDEARAAAIEAIEPGVSGAAVHAAASDVIEAAGIATLRTDPETEVGFTHSTGHGVGLAVHEAPRIAPDADTLEAGQVVTVEPGVYDPSIGGVRIEDLVVVTEDGCRNLTALPTALSASQFVDQNH
ncbi:M24 family metallopeptidase [Halococcoides cellulosivorans]|uniref:Peptidase M24 n=1 Tax=Halococcoides cellulosivorans TaxID=1679096 RepID=A0A2R4WZP6_9EURY|nr:Xaa-Pro peptidase family protein [Halococcoides cellulosivorans]AWB26999.1 peptidase M24 [Halococcoides cellulosivorans]